jgi:hypothetical protein
MTLFHPSIHLIAGLVLFVPLASPSHIGSWYSLLSNLRFVQDPDQVADSLVSDLKLIDDLLNDQAGNNGEDASQGDYLRWPAVNAGRVIGFPSLLENNNELDHAAATQGPLKPKAMSAAHRNKNPIKDNSEPNEAAPFSEVIVRVRPKNAEEFFSEALRRKDRIEACLINHYTKPVSADSLRPWSIMHGVLAYGQNSLVVSQGKRISAVDYLCQNGVGNDRRLLMLNQDKLAVAVGAGFQGHEGQLLAILAQVQTPIDHPISVHDKSFTVRDLIEYEKATCRAGTELTFKLIGLSVYLASDEVWKDSTGQGWDISRLMYEEMNQPINGAACGGTHRLMGLSYAVEMRRARGEPIDGQWKRAETFLTSYQNQALTSLQNPDGGFSTEFFEGRSQNADPIRQIYSTGHCLEWLAISLSDEQLVSPAVTRMVDRLLSLLEGEYRPRQELNGNDVGPKGHALRALRLYELRVFGEASNHLALAAQDPRPVVGAQEIPSLQKDHRVIMATSSQASSSWSSSSNTGKPSSNIPNSRGRQMMRRR